MLALRDLAHPRILPLLKEGGGRRRDLKCPYTVRKIMNLMHTSKIKFYLYKGTHVPSKAAYSTGLVKNVFSFQILWRDLEALKNRAAV
jgi:hypothetical protein